VAKKQDFILVGNGGIRVWGGWKSKTLLWVDRCKPWFYCVYWSASILSTRPKVPKCVLGNI